LSVTVTLGHPLRAPRALACEPPAADEPAMRIRRRLALLPLLAALAVPLVGVGGAHAEGETCTTAIGGGLPEDDRVLLDACAAAVLVVTPNPAVPGQLVTLDGSESTSGDGSETITGLSWVFGDGATSGPSLAPSVTHTYARGIWPARLTVDFDGEPLTDSVQVTVGEPPVATLDVPTGTLQPGVRYTFDAGASADPHVDGSIVRYDWDFGDETVVLDGGPVVEHAFARDGASTEVTVTVVNDLGLSDTTSEAILVDNEPPLVQLIATPATVAVGQQLTLDASGSSDPDGAVAEYRWDLDANGHCETSTGSVPSVVAGGYPNPGVLFLKVCVRDDSTGESFKSVPVTVLRPASGGGGSGGGSGSGGSGGGSGSGGSGGSGAGGSSSRGGDGSGGSGAGPGTGAGDVFAVGLSGSAIQKLKAALARGVALSATANRSAVGTLSLNVGAREARKLRLPGRRGKRPVTIGTLRLSLRPGRTAKPKIKLKPAAARALRRAKPRSLRVTIRGSLAAGADRAAVVRVVLLRG
jgi:hypothetical protein